MQSIMDTSLVPFDITFKIKGSGKTFQAHKCIMGMASPVFSNIFFGELKETNDIIIVEEARDGAFSRAIDYIYNKGITWAGEDEIEDIVAIADVAERYEIKALMEVAQGRFEDVSICEDNVVEVAAAALKFMRQKAVSNNLFYNCVRFLQNRLTKTEDFVSFANKYCDSDAQNCKAALKLVASFSDPLVSNIQSVSESASKSPLKISGIKSLVAEENQTQVNSEDPQVKQELPSPPQTETELLVKVCKEEQNQISFSDGESKEYFEVEVKEQEDCELDFRPSDCNKWFGLVSAEAESAPTSNVVHDDARQLLLVTDQPTPCPELVGGRKPGLIFTEVWQIPVMEMGREGAFANHCGKALLLDVLDSIQEMSTMVDISVSDQLRNKEEFKLLQDPDRQEIVAEASIILNTTLEAIREKMNIEEEKENPVVSLEVFKLHQKLAKVWPGKEKDVFIFLRDVFAVINNKAVGMDKTARSVVLSYWSARLAALAGDGVGLATSPRSNIKSIAAQDKEKAEFEENIEMAKRKHCFVCEVEFNRRGEFVEHCKMMHGVTVGCIAKGKTTMRVFEKDNTENISRIKKLKYRKKINEYMKDAKDDIKKKKDIVSKKGDEGRKVKARKQTFGKLLGVNAHKADGREKTNKIRIKKKETRASSIYIAPKNNNSQEQIALVKTPTRKMVVFYCPHCEEGFYSKERKEAHARKMTCYFKF